MGFFSEKIGWICNEVIGVFDSFRVGLFRGERFDESFDGSQVLFLTKLMVFVWGMWVDIFGGVAGGGEMGGIMFFRVDVV